MTNLRDFRPHAFALIGDACQVIARGATVKAQNALRAVCKVTSDSVDAERRTVDCPDMFEIVSASAWVKEAALKDPKFPLDIVINYPKVLKSFSKAVAIDRSKYPNARRLQRLDAIKKGIP